MPRPPTGRPRGRPAGSGQLGEEGTGHKRLTVRLPVELYDALEALAEREHYTREAPELARTVRTALEHYLACPHRRQTGIVPHTVLAHNAQTENDLETLENYTRQTIITPEPLEDYRGQTAMVPEPEHTALHPSLEKAMLMRRLRQMRASGLSLSQIAGQLQAEGLPTLSGKGQWQKGTVDKLLRASTV
jgi:hypothetical protein